MGICSFLGVLRLARMLCGTNVSSNWSERKCPRVFGWVRGGWGVQSLFGQCPNVGVNILNVSFLSDNLGLHPEAWGWWQSLHCHNWQGINEGDRRTGSWPLVVLAARDTHQWPTLSSSPFESSNECSRGLAGDRRRTDWPRQKTSRGSTSPPSEKCPKIAPMMR